MVPADEKPELAHLSIFETKRQRGKKSSMQRRMMRIFHPWSCFQTGVYRGKEVDCCLFIAQGLKGSSKYKQRDNMGEIRKPGDGLFQCRNCLALQRKWNMWGGSNSGLWSGSIGTYIAHIELELVLSLHSLAAAGHRFLLPASHSQLLGMFRQALYVTMWRCDWH